jgi:hypothetical protein
MVSLLVLPFPKGGSLSTPWPAVCAIAPAANTELNATAKTKFFTIFSVVFRGAEWVTRGRGFGPAFLSSFKAGAPESFVALYFSDSYFNGSSIGRSRGDAAPSSGAPRVTRRLSVCG